MSEAELAERVAFEIVDLPENLLGQAAARAIRIDDDAAGRGWFIDASPADHDEFLTSARPGELLARGGSPDDGRIDLLTVVMHELRHLLGYDHQAPDDVMEETLAPGTRRLFSFDASALQANDVLFEGLGSAPGSL